ncbi:transposase [Methyloglobulus sp.]|uniref:IS110 family transposase n=1 Tax=Methyloglobulus sp. TaxID=2518622 RepID=UPI0032B71E53
MSRVNYLGRTGQGNCRRTTNQSFTAFVGIDWADKKHDVCVQSADSETREFSVIPHKVEMINDWAQSLIQRFGSPIAVAVELSKGPIVSALQKFDCFVICPINPLTLAKYRQAFTPSRAKDDPTNAEFAVDILLRHPDRFKPLRPQSMEMRALATLVEQRRRGLTKKIVSLTACALH